MRVVSQNDCSIEEIASSLLGGETLIYPTETCYGLGCDATNQDAVNRIYEIKGREEGKPLIVLASDVAMVKQYVVWNDTIEALASRYWSGPLTIVADARPGTGLADGVVSRDGAVAVRVTAHPLAHSLVETLGRPFVSTSANLAGEPNIYAFADIERVFGTASVQPDIAIDAGVLPVNPPSTLVRVRASGELQILRQGALVVTL